MGSGLVSYHSYLEGLEYRKPLVLQVSRIVLQNVSLVLIVYDSAGSFLSNGTLANFGGHPYTDRNGQAAPDGQQGVRMFTGCAADGSCDMYEHMPVSLLRIVSQ